MGPEHHEERLRRWARKFGRDRETGEVKKRVVISVDYGKSPECQYELVRIISKHVCASSADASTALQILQILTHGPSKNVSTASMQAALEQLSVSTDTTCMFLVAFDTYVSLVHSKGHILGMKSNEINIIMCGDSACVSLYPFSVLSRTLC